MLYAASRLKLLVLFMVLMSQGVYGSKHSLTHGSLPSSSSSIHCAPLSSEISWRVGIFAAFMIANLSWPTVVGRVIVPLVDSVTMDISVHAHDYYQGSCVVSCGSMCSPILALTNDIKTLSCVVNVQNCANWQEFCTDSFFTRGCPLWTYSVQNDDAPHRLIINFSLKPTIDAPLNNTYMLCKNGDQFAYHPFPHNDGLISKGLVNIMPSKYDNVMSSSPATLTHASVEERALLCKKTSLGITYLNQKNFASCLKRDANGDYQLSESIDFSQFSEADKAIFPINFGTPFSGSLYTGDYTIDNVFINEIDVIGLFESLSHSRIVIRFGFVSIQSVATHQNQDEEKIIDVDEVGLLARKIFSHNDIHIEVQGCHMNIYSHISGMKVGLVAGSILGRENTIFVQVSKYLNMYIVGEFSRIGGIFGSAHAANNVYTIQIEKMSMHVGGRESYIGGIGGLVENHNKNNEGMAIIRASEVKINSITIVAVASKGMIGAFFGKWVGKMPLIGAFQTGSASIMVMGREAYIGFLAGMVDVHDMNVNLQLGYAVLNYADDLLGRIGLVAGWCLGDKNRVFFHDTAAEVNVHKTTVFSVFANLGGELIATINNVDVCFERSIVPVFLIQSVRYLNPPTKSKLKLFSFSLSLSPSNSLLMTDCHCEIFVDQAGVNFNARAIQCPNTEILDSTISSDWRMAQEKIIKNVQDYYAYIFYANEKTVSLVARGDNKFLLVSRQVYPCNRVADRSGLQRIIQYKITEEAYFYPESDIEFGINGTLLYGPSHKNIELFTDFPISTFADQNILLQIYWIKDILYITSFDLTLHKDSVYRVKDIRDVQKENNTCLPVQLDGHGLWIQCDNVLSYFRIDIPTLSIKNVAERSINLNDHFSYRDFLLGARYKEGYVYTAELKKKNSSVGMVQ